MDGFMTHQRLWVIKSQILFIYIYIKFRVKENLYKIISNDTIGIDSRGTQNKIIKHTKAFSSGDFQVFIPRKIR